MRNYEIMWIIGSGADQAVVDRSIETVSGLITRHGGEVVSSQPWGRRTLSYPIQHNTEGHYFVAQFRMEPAATVAFERDVHLEQTVIRHLVTRLDHVEELEAAPAPAPAPAEAVEAES